MNWYKREENKNQINLIPFHSEGVIKSDLSNKLFSIFYEVCLSQ